MNNRGLSARKEVKIIDLHPKMSHTITMLINIHLITIHTPKDITHHRNRLMAKDTRMIGIDNNQQYPQFYGTNQNIISSSTSSKRF